MFDDDLCEQCGAVATRTAEGVDLCDVCDPYEEDEPEPPHWPAEVPMGLLGLDEINA